MQLFGWMIHPVRMKRNKSLFNELYSEICDELNSNYWRNDISKEMKDIPVCRLTRLARKGPE